MSMICVWMWSRPRSSPPLYKLNMFRWAFNVFELNQSDQLFVQNLFTQTIRVCMCVWRVDTKLKRSFRRLRIIRQNHEYLYFWFCPSISFLSNRCASLNFAFSGPEFLTQNWIPLKRTHRCSRSVCVQKMLIKWSDLRSARNHSAREQCAIIRCFVQAQILVQITKALIYMM